MRHTEPVIKDALVSEDGRYRYWLARIWDEESWTNFICLNPSTADARENDPTVRRLEAFARNWGGGFILTNLYAFRSTEPDVLWTGTPDPVGPENDHYLRWASMTCDRVVVAWGTKARYSRVQKALQQINRANLTLLSIGPPTAKGQPKHPLYLPSTSQLQEWKLWWLKP